MSNSLVSRTIGRLFTLTCYEGQSVEFQLILAGLFGMKSWRTRPGRGHQWKLTDCPSQQFGVKSLYHLPHVLMRLPLLHLIAQDGERAVDSVNEFSVRRRKEQRRDARQMQHQQTAHRRSLAKN